MMTWMSPQARISKGSLTRGRLRVSRRVVARLLVRASIVARWDIKQEIAQKAKVEAKVTSVVRSDGGTEMTKSQVNA